MPRRDEDPRVGEQTAQGFPPRPGTDPIAFHGTVTRTADQWTLAIEIGPAPFHQWKTLEAETCQTLADTFALMIAFSSDPELSAKDPGFAPPVALASEVPVADASDGSTEHSPAETKPSASVAKLDAQPGGKEGGDESTLKNTRAAGRERGEHLALANSSRIEIAQQGSGLRLSGGPVGALGAGLLPFPAWAAGVAVAADADAGYRVQLSGLYWPAREATIGKPLEGGVLTRLWWGELAVCQLLGSGRFGLCGGGQVGEMHAAGIDLPHMDEGRSWWAALIMGGWRSRRSFRVLASEVDLIWGFPYSGRSSCSSAGMDKKKCHCFAQPRCSPP